MVAFKEEMRTCEKHGEFNAKIYTVGGKWLGGHCPVCETEKKQLSDARDKQLAQFESKRKIEEQLKRSMIPKRFQSKTIDSFETNNDGQDKAKRISQWYVNTWTDRLENGTCLLFCGNVGTGKTHLSTAIANAVIGAGYSALFTTIADVMRSIKSTYDKSSDQSERQAISAFTVPDLLIIDEISVSQGSEHEKRLMFEIINKRYEDIKPTIVLTNLSPDGLKENLGERILDRLREGGGKMVLFNWESSRG